MKLPDIAAFLLWPCFFQHEFRSRSIFVSIPVIGCHDRIGLIHHKKVGLSGPIGFPHYLLDVIGCDKYGTRSDPVPCFEFLLYIIDRKQKSIAEPVFLIRGIIVNNQGRKLRGFQIVPSFRILLYKLSVYTADPAGRIAVSAVVRNFDKQDILIGSFQIMHDFTQISV